MDIFTLILRTLSPAIGTSTLNSLMELDTKSSTSQRTQKGINRVLPFTADSADRDKQAYSPLLDLRESQQVTNPCHPGKL